MSIPAPRTPIGQPTDADKTRAADRLSMTTGRDIRPGSWAAHALAEEFAMCYRDGYEAAIRHLTAEAAR